MRRRHRSSGLHSQTRWITVAAPHASTDLAPRVCTNRPDPTGPHRNNTPDDQRLELLQGTLDMLVLQTLQWGPQHGHGIGQAIRAKSDELLKVETGSLYPALHRLLKRGWLEAEWGVSEANQRAKYYRLTADGKAQLLREQDRWSQLVHAIGRIMTPSPAREE